MAKKRTDIMKNKRATMHDVAKIANVSVMTVSNVVNGKYEFVSEKTKQRVEKVIKELNYHPSATSRRLRKMQEFSIGMLIVDDSPAYLEDPFITEIVAGLSNYLDENKYSLSIQGVHPQDFSNAVIFSTVSTDALCAILCGPDNSRKNNINFLLTRSQPIVVFQETLGSPDSNLAIVNQDDYEGGYMIASHVLSKGANRLVFLEPSMKWPAIEERKRGVNAAAKDAKKSSVDVISCEDEGFEQTQLEVGGYISKNGLPDAILGGNDRLGIAALRYCQDNGIRVPEDIMITGYNGFISCRYTNPALTTIVSPAYEMGQYAGALIINKLQTSKFLKRKTLYPVRFQQGGSA